MGTETDRAVQRACEIQQALKLTPPVNVESAAKHLGYAVIRRDLEPDISGMFVAGRGKGTIVVNQNHHPNRQRFSIAHELGHGELHQHGGKDGVFVDGGRVQYRNADSASGTQLHEISANRFAAELLMPEDALKAAIPKLIRRRFVDATDELTVERLASHFDVSAHAMTVRLTQLGLFAFEEDQLDAPAI